MEQITIFTTDSGSSNSPNTFKRARLTKKFSCDVSGNITKSDYDRAYLYTVQSVDVTSIDDLADALSWLETQPYSCIVRGETIGEVDVNQKIRRALVNDPEKGPATIRPVAKGRQWVMLDFDKLPVASLNLTTEAERLEYLVSLLPPEFQGVTYYYQWSASAALDGWVTLSCHLWYWLTEPWLCRDLYERFATGDWSACEVDPAPFTVNQPHYTAAPIFDGMADPVEHRSGIVRHDRDAVLISTWFKPVEPAPTISNREHYELFGLSRFDDLLADIGPHFHRPILRAAAHYVNVVGTDDLDNLRERLIDAIHAAPSGRNRKADYLDRHYLDRVIQGAVRKFGRAF